MTKLNLSMQLLLLLFFYLVLVKISGSACNEILHCVHVLSFVVFFFFTISMFKYYSVYSIAPELKEAFTFGNTSKMRMLKVKEMIL